MKENIAEMVVLNICAMLSESNDTMFEIFSLTFIDTPFGSMLLIEVSSAPIRDSGEPWLIMAW